MKKITAISVQKKNPNRVNIYLDGEYAFGVARITAAWLKNGDELSDEKISKLLAEDAREWAYQQALLYLSYRARSEKEIRQNLRKHEMPEEVIEETIERLRKAGLPTTMNLHRRGLKTAAPFDPAAAEPWPWNSVKRGSTMKQFTPQFQGWMKRLWLTKLPKKGWAGSKVWSGTNFAKSYLSSSRGADSPTPSSHPS